MSYLYLYTKTLHKKSMEAAERGYCLKCIGYLAHLKKEVINCTNKDCPLYEHKRMLKNLK